jgi:uncharacterized protein involved in outer membrane biogenesis
MGDRAQKRGIYHRGQSYVRRHPWRSGFWAALGLVGLLLVSLIIFLWLANWNSLRGPIGRYASAATHRHVEIDGDLKVHLLTWTPTVSVGGLKVGAPAWAGPGDTADVKTLVVSLRLPSLLTGRVVLPLMEFDQPNLSLLRDRTGRTSWSLAADPAKPGKPFKLPPIQQFIVKGGHVNYVDQIRRLTLSGTIDSNEQASGAAAHAFSLIGQGLVNNRPFALKLDGGPLLNVRLDQPYPFTGDVRAADTHVTVSGHLAKPFDTTQYDMTMHMTGNDLADLYYLTGLALPNTPRYDVRGELHHNGLAYDFEHGAGQIGDSDIEGGLKVQLSVENRPQVTADLTSRRLDFKDLATLFGAPPVRGHAAAKPMSVQMGVAAPTAATGDKRLLPDATLATERLRGMDAKLRYRAATVTSVLPLRQASLDLTLDHGVLSIDPVAFDFPQGRLWAQVKLDARGAVPITDADIRLNNVDLQEFTSRGGGSAPPPFEGVLAARAKLHGVGDSVHRAAAASNGAVTVIIPHGKIRSAFAELLGVNAGKGLALLLAKNQNQSDIRCAVADFSVRDGVLQARDVVFDTDVVKVTGSGNINLGTEAIDMGLKGETKRFRIGHVFLPLTIGGSLAAPKFGVNPAPAVAQVGAAVALGAVLTPLASILPFVDPGLAKNADCAALINEVQSTAAPIKRAQVTAAHGK